MQRQTLLWTLLPNGRVGNRLRVTAFLSPRLDSNEPAKSKLAGWSDFWNAEKGHWPAIAAALKFSVSFDGGAQKVPCQSMSSGPDPVLWGKIFRADTYVKPFAFTDLSKRMIVSFPAAVLGFAVEGVYASLAGQGGTELPSLIDQGSNSLRPLIDALQYFDQREDGIEKQVRGLMEQARRTESSARQGRVFDHTKLTGMPPALAPFVAAHLFYNRPKPAALTKYHRKPGAATLAEVPNRPDIPKTDFHMMIAGMSDWPNILRAMGLAIDLEFDLPAGTAATGRLRFDPFAPSPFAPYTVAAPYAWTRYRLGASSFMAAPRNDTDMEEGYLRLEDKERFFLSTIDIDGTTLKTINTARNVHRSLRQRFRTPVTPTRGGLPTVRSAGLQILRVNRGQRTAQRLVAVQELNNRIAANDPGTEYYVDDLLRGYRVDIRDDAVGKWFSLCERIARYIVPADGSAIEFTEEGYVKGASATSSSDGTPDDIYLHEELFAWEGWSLVAPRPGKTIVQDFHEYKADGKGRKAKTGGREYAEFNRNLDEYRDHRQRITFETDFHAKANSLPRLRFGRSYAVRARTVDLAGNGLPPNDSNEAHLAKGKYLRFDPIIAPVLLPLTPFAEGESLERMVIRSDVGLTPEDYRGQGYVVDLLTGKWYSYAKENVRWLAPPKASQLSAEFHGMFDVAMGSGDASVIQKAFNIAAREQGTFLDPKIINIDTGLRTIAADGIAIVTPPTVPVPTTQFPPDPWGAIPAPPAGVKYWRPGDPLSPGQYVVHNTPKLLLPYLPDPIARGVTFRGLPKAPNGGGAGQLQFSGLPDSSGNVSMVTFGGSWPVITPFRLQIIEGDGEPKWDESGQMLTVFLPKALKVDILFSSFLRKDGNGADDIQLMRLFEIAPAAKRADIQRLAEMGSHWMLTPWRTLTLVHAVQKPLEEPKPTDQFQAYKQPNGIGETFAAVRGSIGAHVASTGKIDILAKWDEPVDRIGEPEPRRIDGKAHVVDFEIGEEFVGFYTDNVQLPIPSKPDHAVAKKESRNIYKHEFGDTKYRKVDYYLKGTTRFREYFPISLFRDPVNRPEHDDETDSEKLKRRMHRIGPKVTREIYNSARPATPMIRYIIPTFGWPEEERAERSVLSKRCGNGLRVLIERPWYSSGDGELLGVVLQQTGGALLNLSNDVLRDLTTRWGKDPIWGSANMASLPSPSSFANADKVGTNLSIVEREGVKVDVVGYPVEFDKDRGLWFSDIEINAGNTYNPFIRLALCRYQPKSISDCHLSPIVRPPFAQLLPDRVTAVVIDSGDDKKIRVIVSGIYGTNQLTRSAPVAANQTPPPLPNLDLSRVLTVTIEEIGLTVGANVGESDQSGGDVNPQPRGNEVYELTTRSVRREKEMKWQPVRNDLKDIALNQYRKEGEKMVWMAEVMLPKGVTGLATGQPRYRLQIRERELLETDPDVGSRINRLSREWYVASRIVYADTIILNAKG